MSATTVSRSRVSESPHGWSDARSIAGRLALPAILLVVFGAIWLYDRSKGGHKAVKIS